ncbi:hypothetical protein QT972_26690 [Microcoleus sp. herbarium7]|uniref:hypothetical protein n=1 Tax=Microcoleus sp. herbarium7 TaxID=3055435 RepID=UPI002FD18D1C
MIDEHFDLMQRLEQEPDLIESRKLWDYDASQQLANFVNQLAQPLPNGQPSPFSSMSTTSGHVILGSAIIAQMTFLAYELNLKPDHEWVQDFRMLGVERELAEYPVINLVFRRSNEAMRSGLAVEIPYNCEVRSSRDPSLVAYTIKEDIIFGSDEFKVVPARINRLGRIPGLIVGEFSVMPRLLANVAAVANDGTAISEGRDRETLIDMMIKARNRFRRGNAPNLTTKQIGRVVTIADYYLAAQEFGSRKTLVLSSQYGTVGHWSDLVTVAVWPEQQMAVVEEKIRPLTMESQPLEVRAAEIVPIDGKVTVGFIRDLTQQQQFNLVAQTIVENVNPPFGIWGDLEFYKTLSSELEKAEGIYSVPKTELKNSATGQPLSEIEISPWTLFEVQSSLEVIAA